MAIKKEVHEKSMSNEGVAIFNSNEFNDLQLSTIEKNDEDRKTMKR